MSGVSRKVKKIRKFNRVDDVLLYSWLDKGITVERGSLDRVKDCGDHLLLWSSENPDNQLQIGGSYSATFNFIFAEMKESESDG